MFMKLRNRYKREYRIWKAMRSRCNAPCFDNSTYRMKKIKCCKRWNSFANFVEDMGECPEGYSIDRIDNNGNYEPSNCRWADRKTQCSNRGDFTPLIEYKGEKHILKDWCRILNKNYSTMYSRIHVLNMSFENALNYVDPRDKLLYWEGEYYTKKELSEKYNIPLPNFYDRRHKGWSLQKILLTPVIHKI